jgi:hypothetical protein
MPPEADTTQASTAPVQTGTEQSSAAAGTQQSGGTSQAAAAPAGGSDAPARPEGLPDAFWDATTNSIKTGDLVGKFNELTAFEASERSRRAAVPESADKYELKIPEGTELPEGVEFKLDPESPLLKIARDAAHAAGMDQATFEGSVLKPFIQIESARAYQETKNLEAATAAADKELGAQADVRRDAVKTYLAAKFGASELDWAQHILPVPGFVKLMERVMHMDRSGGMPGFKGTGRDGAPDNAPSDEEWSKMTPAARMSAGMKADNARRARA